MYYFFIRLPNAKLPDEKLPMAWPVFLLYNKFRIHNSTTHDSLGAKVCSLVCVQI